jgi:hypothetical protein
MLNNNLQAINSINTYRYPANRLQAERSQTTDTVNFKGTTYAPRREFYVKVDDTVIIPEKARPENKPLGKKIAETYHKAVRKIAEIVIKIMEAKTEEERLYGYKISYYV